MSRRPTQITHAEIARAVRAAKQAGAAEVEIRIGDQVIVIRLEPSTGSDSPLADTREIVL